ncbi:MAG: hypothetical protein V2B18_16125, partial [Pseudomonadota bacterium]
RIFMVRLAEVSGRRLVRRVRFCGRNERIAVNGSLSLPSFPPHPTPARWNGSREKPRGIPGAVNFTIRQEIIGGLCSVFFGNFPGLYHDRDRRKADVAHLRSSSRPEEQGKSPANMRPTSNYLDVSSKVTYKAILVFSTLLK